MLADTAAGNSGGGQPLPPPAAADAAAASSSYDSMRRLQLLRLCRERGLEYKPVAKDEAKLRALLAEADRG